MKSNHSPEPAAGPQSNNPPDWVHTLRQACRTVQGTTLTRLKPRPSDIVKPAATLMLFAGNQTWPQANLLLTRRAAAMRSHAGHVALPGGRVDRTDTDACAAALRETREETNLDTQHIHVLGTLPKLYIPVSGFEVTTIVAWAPTPLPVAAGDPAEVTDVSWVGVHQLLDPTTWRRTRLSYGHLGPAYDLPGLFVWGFTGGLLQKFLTHAELSPPWGSPPVVPIPPDFGG